MFRSLLCIIAIVKVSAYPETKVSFNGQERSWLTHVPSTINPSTPVPLVVDMHGWGGSKEEVATYTRFAEMSSTEKFIVVWPDGVSKKWGGSRDINFLRMVVSCTASHHNIDPRRVYFTGHSMGCIQSQVMARDASDIVAAVACFAGNLQGTNFPGDYKPVSVLDIHGTGDTVVPYSSAQSSFATWSAKNGCTATVTTTKNGYTLYDHSSCNGGTKVQLMALPPDSFRGKSDGSKYGMHWPYIMNSQGNGCSLFDTSKLAWAFLESYKSDATTKTITAAQCSIPTTTGDTSKGPAVTASQTDASKGPAATASQTDSSKEPTVTASQTDASKGPAATASQTDSSKEPTVTTSQTAAQVSSASRVFFSWLPSNEHGRVSFFFLFVCLPLYLAHS